MPPVWIFPPDLTAASTSSAILLRSLIETLAPSCTPASVPLPIFNCDIACENSFVNCSAIFFCTYTRFAAVQAAPPLRILAIINPATAAGISASSNTTNGAFPPSSMEQRITRSAASRMSTRPTSVDPVKERFFTRGSCRIFEIDSPTF
ncbi:unannotated protein [freshwater metagenome]|uniref:Unannotated protein n=1 Tax=freshwater metagenome TaxID=449393 RepID=A0A6J6UMS7_9ZZZZ